MSDIKHLSDLTPDPKNARRHNPRNIGMLERALNEVGAARSIVIDEAGVVLAGNATIEAAAQAGIERVRVVEADGNEIVAVRRRGLTPEQKTKLALYDNRVAELAEWEPEVLAGFADELDLSHMFTDDELDAIFADAEPEIVPGDGGDEFDPTPQDGPTRAQPGDLWIIGDVHRLIVGDCTDPAVVERLMGGERPKALILDPPYGMRLDADFSGMRNHLDFASEKGIKNGRKYDNVIGDHEDYDASSIRAAFKDVKEQFWFGADYYSATLGDTMHEGAWLVWDKRLEENADRMYGSCFELLWSAQKHKRDMLRHKWAGIFGTEHEPQRGREHPNQKPVRLYEDIMGRWIDEGAIVGDFYAGSGVTLTAAHRTGRRAYLCEILPKYADVILRRAEAEGLTVERVD